MTEALVTVNKPKVPMAFAATILSRLCDQIDDGVDPSDALVAVFEETKLDLADAVDRRIAFETWLSGSIETAKKARDAYAERARKLTAAHEAFKKNTMDIMQANPNLPYKGDLGRLAIQANPASLKLAFAGKELTPDVIAMFGVDQKYVKTFTTLVLDTVAVKAALQAGETFEWATLERGQSLRFRK